MVGHGRTTVTLGANRIADAVRGRGLSSPELAVCAHHILRPFDKRESLANFIEATKVWWSEMAGFYEIFGSASV